VSGPPGSVLFVCNLNAVRSPMAAGLLARRFGRTVWVRSCGVRPGEAVDPLAVEVMDELGVAIDDHRPTAFADLDDDNFDVVITLTPEAHHYVLDRMRTSAAEVEYWPTLDPTEDDGTRARRLETYRTVRDALDARIARRFIAPST